MKRKSAAGACLLVALSVGLTACSSSSKTADPGRPPGNAATDDKHPTSQQPDSGGKAIPKGDACALVSVAQVAAATAHDVDPKPISNAGNGASVCDWVFSNEAEAGITMVVAPMSEKIKADIGAARGKIKAVDGLGFPAYGGEAGQIDDGAELIVDAGSWVLTVQASGPELKVAKLVPIAKAALAH